MRYRIEQVCHLRFAVPAREHHVQIRLAPWDDESQSLIRIALTIDPETPAVARLDGFGNLSHHFAILDAHREVTFSLVAEVETRRANPFDFTPVALERERAWIADSLHQAPRLWDFVLHRSLLTPTLPEQISGRTVPRFCEDLPLLQQVRGACDWIGGIIRFDPALTRPATALSDCFSAGVGTAADLAHLLIALVRDWSVPARFVSGYLDAAHFDPDETDPPGTGPRPQTIHHWAEVLIPGAGWRGFDPAFGLLADATYVRVAVGRDARDIETLRQTCRSDDESPAVEQTLTVSRLT